MATAAGISQVDSVSLPKRSMFASTPVYSLDDGTLVFGLRLPSVMPATGDVSATVSSSMSQRLDLISQKLYGNPASWWAIADCSGLFDPFAGVPPGTVLRAPSAQRLAS